MNGIDDSLTPYKIARDYCGRVLESGAHCRVVGYETGSHGFLFPQIDDGKWHRKSLEDMDRFLVELGFLEP